MKSLGSPDEGPLPCLPWDSCISRSSILQYWLSFHTLALWLAFQEETFLEPGEFRQIVCACVFAKRALKKRLGEETCRPLRFCPSCWLHRAASCPAEVPLFAPSRPWEEGKSAYETLPVPQAEVALLWGSPQLPDGTICGSILGTSDTIMM
ncbi:hypothetical protein L345_02064, partial [Ophiophagus hannah]